MDLLRRHGGHGHGHPSEDSVRQHQLAALYWYVLAAVLVLGFIGRLVSTAIARHRIRRRGSRAGASSSVSALETVFHGPQAAISTSVLAHQRPQWLAAVSLKKTFLVAIYAAFVAFLITYKSIQHDGNFYERIGFRAAWITATQTSLPFLLAARFNPIGLVLGTSYERINWFHRWASRVFLASATVHGGFFVTEWIRNDFFWQELRTVKMVIPGMGAWCVLVWTLISSFLPIRRFRYEFFVFQHIISVSLLLVLLVLHVPEHHLFSIWCAVGVYVYDLITRCANPVWRNIRLHSPSGAFGRVPRFAHQATVQAVGKELTIVNVRHVGFNWIPGQHVLVWFPTFLTQSPHPFTISSISDSSKSGNDVLLTLKTKAGLTKKLNRWARKSQRRGGDGSIRLFLAGPYGALPNWRQYDTVILIAASTGGSFTTPILEDLMTSQSPSCVRRISALYIVRRKTHAEPYLQQISQAASQAKELGISVRVEVAITRGKPGEADTGNHPGDESRERLIQSEPRPEGRGDSVELERFSIESHRSSASERSDRLLKEEMDTGLNGVSGYTSTPITETAGRPDIALFLRSAVGNVPGTVAVAVCGGQPIEQAVYRTVTSLRRERAAEGLGQAIMIHMERSDN